MFELSASNATDYLRQAHRVSDGELLIKSLSGGVSNVVLQIYDPEFGARVGTDLRSAEEIASGVRDMRSTAGQCFVLKQPLPRFKTASEWIVDIQRVEVERDCIGDLGERLPTGSVPRVEWYDAENFILAISCAPSEAMLWKKELLAGRVQKEAADHAGLLLAMMHNSTFQDEKLRKRYGEPTFFVQQRIDPYLRTIVQKHPDLALPIDRAIASLLQPGVCLIHGDFSPKNIFLIPDEETKRIASLLLLDFEVAFFGNPAFDIATLLNHFLLKAFHLPKQWRSFFLLADYFWQTYAGEIVPELEAAMEREVTLILPALLLARVDGKSPAEYLGEVERECVRGVARATLSQGCETLDDLLGQIAGAFSM